MTTPSYDLIHEPWIPAVQADGRSTMLGLRETLLRASELRGICGNSPLETAAIYRLLLALLYRIFGTPTLERWVEIWELGRFPSDAIESYFVTWHTRFDLFHPHYPFLQWKGSGTRTKSVAHFVPHMASGNNATLFDHHHEMQEVVLTPVEAARALLVTLCCAPAGGMGMAPKQSKDAPWARGIVFLAEGNTLFETSMLNYLPIDRLELATAAPENDRPFWEANDPLAPRRDVPLGIADYLTWPTRAIRLRPWLSKDGWVVKQVDLAPGLSLNATVLDPYKHYRLDTKRGSIALRFQERRALWRDSAALLQLHTRAQRPPRSLEWLAYLVLMGVLPRHRRYRFMALGMANDQAKIEFYREEHFPLPAEYLTDATLVAQLVAALTLAEEAHSVLGKALHRLAELVLSPSADDPGGRQPDREDVRNLISHWGGLHTYWVDLEVAFLDLLIALPNKPRQAEDQWRRCVKHAARETFQRVAASLGDTPRALKAIARAERQLEGALFCVFNPHDPKCVKKQAKRNKRREK
nr:type I-E CRISPR-associated protein Cse1/CasA [Ardenticatena sp.]